MGIINAGIDVADNYGRATQMVGYPCFSSLGAVGVGRRSLIAVHTPEAAPSVVGIIWNQLHAKRPIILSKTDKRIFRKRLNYFVGSRLIDLDQQQVTLVAIREAHGIYVLSAHSIDRGRLLFCGCTQIKLHQNFGERFSRLGWCRSRNDTIWRSEDGNGCRIILEGACILKYKLR